MQDRAAWRARDLGTDRSWVIALAPAEIADLERALARMKRASVEPEALGADDFPLDEMLGTIRRVRDELTRGRGVVLLRGVPVADHDREDCARLFHGIGLHLGRAIGQSPRGELIGSVRDEGRDWRTDPTSRAYQTRNWLPFHTDPGDVVGLLCIRSAKRGGLSSIASAAAIRDFLAAERPDLLRVLSEPFHYDGRGQEPPGEPPWFALPAFEGATYGTNAFFVREYIESGQRFPDVPRLSVAQLEAIGLLEDLSVDERFRVDMDFLPGDIQLLNNHVALHSRSGFEDHDEPDLKRHLLRLWLNLPEYTDHPPGYRRFMDRIEKWPRRMTAFR